VFVGAIQQVQKISYTAVVLISTYLVILIGSMITATCFG